MRAPDHHDLAARELLSSWRSKALLAAVPPELREAFEGDVHERMRGDVLHERGVDDARRWVRRELLRSLPEMLRLRAVGGAHPVRRLLLAALLAALASAEIVILHDARWSPSTLLSVGLIAAFVVAVVLRAKMAIQILWALLNLVVGLIAAAEPYRTPLVFSQSVTNLVFLAVVLRVPWNFWNWRFLTTWEGGTDRPRRPRSS